MSPWATWAKRRTRSRSRQNIVRVDGQKAVYLAILKQGGDTNTLSVVDGVKNVVAHLTDVPKDIERECGIRPGPIRARRRSTR